MELTIVIVSWNIKDLLEKCLASIFKYQAKVKLEVIVSDNNSSDGTVKMIKEKFPQVLIIVNPSNKGFAVANNQGILKAKGEFILLLNPDTEIHSGTFTQILRFIRGKPQAGIVGCKHLNTDLTLQPSVRRFPSFWVLFLIFIKIAKIFPKLHSLYQYFALDFDYKYAIQVDQVAGSFFLIRRQLIDEIGLLDEHFFIWFEEVDFCKRAIQANWQVWYTPLAKITHHGAQSFNQHLPFKRQKMFFQSAWYYLKKHGVFR